MQYLRKIRLVNYTVNKIEQLKDGKDVNSSNIQLKKLSLILIPVCLTANPEENLVVI
jgi:hypothetical protein